MSWHAYTGIKYTHRETGKSVEVEQPECANNQRMFEPEICFDFKYLRKDLMDKAESFVLLPPKRGGKKSICYPNMSNKDRNKNEKAIGWCGTCQPGARSGSPGYCGPGAASNTANYAEVSAGRGWGYCTHDCNPGKAWSGDRMTDGRVSS